MSFAEVFLRVLFLIGVSIVGLLLGKKLKINQKDISTLLVYLISPAVIFLAVIEAPAGYNYYSFAASAFLLCSFVSLCALIIGRLIWKDSTAFLFAFGGGTGNTGYFGLPLAIGLFDAAGAALAVFIILGVNLYEFSLGYFLTARGVGTVKESLSRLVKLPILYAFVIAAILRQLDVDVSGVLREGLANFKGAYSVLGMLVIGITLSHISKLEIDWKYLIVSLFWKFLVWPLIGLFVIWIIPYELDVVERSMIMLMTTVPMAGNVVIIANQLDVHPEKAATAVMASTLLALISVPLFIGMS
ncbi:MAG: transporter [Alcanivorax sp.]|nr:MAG: transporter [Alcanivorax sp.]